MIGRGVKAAGRARWITSLCAGVALALMVSGGATAAAQTLQIAPGATATLAGGNGHCATQIDPLGDGCPAATNANLQSSVEVATNGSSGNVYIVDHNANVVRAVDGKGIIFTVAGGGIGCTTQTDSIGDGCSATQAILNGPSAIAFDGIGNVYIAEYGFAGNVTPRVRRVDSDGFISTYAGTGLAGYSGDGGQAGVATMEKPTGLAADVDGNVYIVDSGANVVRRVDGNFQISTFAGGGTGCPGQTDSVGDGCPATGGRLLNPFGITVLSVPGAVTVVYIADTNNNRIRKVDGTGTITTVAGTGTQGLSGDNGPATAANLSVPERVVLDSAGNLYISDSGNNRIRKIDNTGTVTSVFGGGPGCTFTPCSALETTGSDPTGNLVGLGIDVLGNLYAGTGDVVQNVGPQGAVAFPATIVGQTSAARTIVLNNIAAAPTAIDALQGGFNTFGDFSFTGGTCITNNVIVPGSSCTLQFVFTPTVAGERSATVPVFDNSLGSPHNITLYGQGNVQAAQTITFPAIANHVYGDAPITLVAQASSGLPVTFSIVGGPATLSGATLTITGAGPVTVEADQAGNAAFLPAAPVQQTFVVARATLTVTAASANRSYGATNPAFSASAIGAVNGDTFTLTESTTATNNSPVGTYAIVPLATGAKLGKVPSYNVVYVNGTLTVGQATLAVTAANASRVYGAANPAFSASAAGALNGDTFSFTESTTATLASPAGTYPIVPVAAGTNLGDYAVVYVNGTLNVGQATLTVTAGSANRTYGSANPAFTASATGAQNDDNFTFTESTVATPGSPVGSYAIVPVAAGANLGNYTVVYANGTLTVNRAVLTVAATSASIQQGQAIPTLTYTTTGFVNGDPPSVVSGTPSLTTTATPSSIAGYYPIVITAGTLGAANYSFAFVNGALTITQSNQTITFAAIPRQVYGNAPFGLTATATSKLPATFSVVSGPASIAGNALTILGAGTVTVQASQAGNSAYTAAAPVQQSFAVAKAALTFTATSATIQQGQALPTLTDTVAGFVNGDGPSVISGVPSITTTATQSSAAGSYPISISAGTLGAANYSFLFVGGALSITAPSLISTISPQETIAGTNGLKLTVNGTSLSPYSVILANGSQVTSSYGGPTQITATLPASLLAKPGIVQIQVRVGDYTAAAVPLTVVPNVVLTSLTPAMAIAQSADTPITAAGLNFTSTTVLQFNGTSLKTTFVSATQLQAIVPAANLATAQTAQVAAFDPASRSQSVNVPFTILASPAVSFTGPPTATPGSQQTLNFQLSQPYPVAVTGTITLTVQPSQGLPIDPAIKFENGGQTVVDTLDANSTNTNSEMLQVGTVAGTITATLKLTANGVDVTPANTAPIVISVPKGVPVITSQSMVRNLNSVTIYVTGYSTSRDMATAYFDFTAAPGVIPFSQSNFAITVTPLFTPWYSSALGVENGSTFTYFQTFTLNSPATDVQSVTVTLENAQGNSQTEVVQ